LRSSALAKLPACAGMWGVSVFMVNLSMQSKYLLRKRQMERGSRECATLR